MTQGIGLRLMPSQKGYGHAMKAEDKPKAETKAKDKAKAKDLSNTQGLKGRNMPAVGVSPRVARKEHFTSPEGAIYDK